MAWESTLWRPTDDEAAYLRLAQWLKRAETLEVEWPDLVRWLSDGAAPPHAAVYKRVNTVGVLARLLPPPVPLDECQLRLTKLPLLAPQREQIPGRASIYKAIRRHYARRFGLRRSADIPGDGDQLIWSGDCLMAMPSRAAVNPTWHGLYAWRLRFEKPLSRRRSRFADHDEQLRWPMACVVSDAAWGHFVHECLLLDVIMAQGLNRALGPLDYGRKEDRPAWLETIGIWRHRFGWHARAWPDGLTVLRRPEEGSKRLGDIYVIAVRSAVCAEKA